MWCNELHAPPAALPATPRSLTFKCLRRAASAHASSALLDLRATKGGVDALVHDAPVDLLEHLVDVARLGAKERTLAEGHGLEQLDCQAAGAHLSCNPNPTLAIVYHLLRLVHAVAHTTLRHKHGVLHLRLEALHTHLDVLLADGAWRRALPEAGIALEALGREVAVEELHDELSSNCALWRVAASAADCLCIEVCNIRVAHLVLTAACLQCNRARPLLAQALPWLERRRCRCCDKGQQQLRSIASSHQEEGGC